MSSKIFLLLLVVPALLFGQSGRQRKTRSPGSSSGIPEGATPLVSMRGVLRSIDKKEIVMDTGDDQIVTLKRTKKTKFLKGAKEIKPEDFPQGAKLFVEASRVMNGDLDAVNVFLGEPPGGSQQSP